jgi:hypothetical protein
LELEILHLLEGAESQLMRPRVAAPEGKIVRIGHHASFHRRGFKKLIGNTLPSQYAMASCLLLKRRRNCWRMSPDEVQTISGSTRRGNSARNQGPKPWYWPGQIAWQSSTACRCGRASVDDLGSECCVAYKLSLGEIR